MASRTSAWSMMGSEVPVLERHQRLVAPHAVVPAVCQLFAGEGVLFDVVIIKNYIKYALFAAVRAGHKLCIRELLTADGAAIA